MLLRSPGAGWALPCTWDPPQGHQIGHHRPGSLPAESRPGPGAGSPAVPTVVPADGLADFILYLPLLLEGPLPWPLGRRAGDVGPGQPLVPVRFADHQGKEKSMDRLLTRGLYWGEFNSGCSGEAEKKRGGVGRKGAGAVTALLTRGLVLLQLLLAEETPVQPGSSPGDHQPPAWVPGCGGRMLRLLRTPGVGDGSHAWFLPSLAHVFPTGWSQWPMAANTTLPGGPCSRYTCGWAQLLGTTCWLWAPQLDELEPQASVLSLPAAPGLGRGS